MNQSSQLALLSATEVSIRPDLASSLKKLSEVLEQLWSSWAFRLSLSSNELFHSNILQYLAEEMSIQSDADPALLGMSDPLEDRNLSTEAKDRAPQSISKAAVLKLLFILGAYENASFKREFLALEAAMTKGSRFCVKREWQQMDLVVGFEEKAARTRKPRTGKKSIAGTQDKEQSIVLKPLFALEVKVKAYPTKAQVVRYRNQLKSMWKKDSANFEPPLFLVTGMGAYRLTDALLSSAMEKEQAESHAQDAKLSEPLVHALDFQNLQRRLQEHFPENLGHVVAQAYIGLCERMHALFQTLASLLDDRLTMAETEHISAKLVPYRLHSLWWKLWGAHVAKRIRDLVGQVGAASDYLVVDHGFTHTGNVNAYWSWKTKDGKKKKALESIGVGVQVEGRSLRLFLNIAHPNLQSVKPGLDARSVTERVLLGLCAQGLFACNPGIQEYLKHWEHANKQFINADQTRSLANIQPTEDGALFESRVGLGRTVDNKGEHVFFCLPGYLNGQNFGHTDFRLLFQANVSIHHMITLIRDILVHGRYSCRQQEDSLVPIQPGTLLPTSGKAGDAGTAPQAPEQPSINPLLQVVRAFENKGDRRIDWINKPTIVT